MGFPSKKEISEVIKELKNVEGSYVLPSNSSIADKVKYEICSKFVERVLETGTTQKELAKSLDIDPARMSEIINYKINKFTIDKLLEYLEILDPKISLELVAA